MNMRRLVSSVLVVLGLFSWVSLGADDTNLVTTYLTIPACQQGKAIGLGAHIEQGFRLACGPGNLVNADNGSQIYGPSNGTSHLIVEAVNALSPVLFMARADLRPFCLLQVDLAEYRVDSITAGQAVSFTGYRMDGSTVTQTVALDNIIDSSGPLADFQTVVFSNAFTNLLYATARCENYSFCVDNIVARWSQRDSAPAQPLAPTAAVLWPYDGNSFLSKGGNICVTAMAFDLNGPVAALELYTNNVLAATMTNATHANPAVLSSALVVAPGEYLFQAAVLDAQAGRIFSPPNLFHVASPDQVAMVSLAVTDAFAAETAAGSGPDCATVLIQRVRELTNDLKVHFVVRGTASNGVDYVMLESPVCIPAGASEVPLSITPLDDALAEGVETITIELLTAPSSQWPIYRLGTNSRASLNLVDNEVKTNNLLPAVRLVSPPNGFSCGRQDSVLLSAAASDPDGIVSTVDFYEGTRLLATVSNQPGVTESFLYYSYRWSNSVPGIYQLSAVATDNEGGAMQSTNIYAYVLDYEVPDSQGLSNGIPVINVFASDSFAAEIVATNQGGGWSVFMTNAACFTFSRSGPTNAAIAVRYVMDGTASNGLDYATLSGIIILPKGVSVQSLWLRPIDDAKVEGTETARLTLIASVPIDAAAKPAYLLGRSYRASVSIADNDRPLPPMVLSDGQYLLSQPATNGQTFVINVSNDLQTWVPISTNTVVDGALYFIDSDSNDYRHRFYRATLLP